VNAGEIDIESALLGENLPNGEVNLTPLERNRRGKIEVAGKTVQNGAGLSKMKTPLHILHLEDSPSDAKLVQSTLEAGGIDCTTTRVQTRGDLISALERGGIDLILSDFSLAAFDGLSAAALVRTRWAGIPLIIVSGTPGEEGAIDSFKNGATDYVLKEHLSRLVPAVRRALQAVDAATKCRRLETHLIEAEKMEAIGRLSSRMAHDFSNILAVIVGYNDLITSALGHESPLRKYTEEIRQASNRAAGLTRQLLVFSRKQLVQPSVIDPNDAIQELNKLIRRLIDEKISITIIPGRQTGRVRVDSGYLIQVLLNLVFNARDAMPDGGRLAIETKELTLDKEYADAHPGTTAGRYAMLSVADTGTGMTEEVKARLFEAFFTTKPSGTGLGLASCRTIVQEAGGHIDVESEVGKGTTVKIYLPRVEQTCDLATTTIRASPSLPRTEPIRFRDKAPPPTRSFQRILVVDDDISIRRLNTEMLIRSGYQVDAATDGEAGWKALQGNSYDLVITDNFMPKVTGVEMVKKLHAAGMKLPVIMATAMLPQEEFISHPWLQDVTTLLKPFRGNDLLTAVKKILASNVPSEILPDVHSV
jgi:two-component system cell cycle sensor histidine kinase/response regulator CckA